MTRKLSDDDRTAVDLLLDRVQAGNGNFNGGEVVMMSNAVSDERLSAVQKILNSLDAMPVPEPSSDLIVRTLQQIARAADTAPATLTQPGQVIDPSAPLA